MVAALLGWTGSRGYLDSCRVEGVEGQQLEPLVYQYQMNDVSVYKSLPIRSSGSIVKSIL